MRRSIGLLVCHARDLNNLREQFDNIPIVIHIQSSSFNYHYNLLNLPDSNS
jgi:hypothetical protein